MSAPHIVLASLVAAAVVAAIVDRPPRRVDAPGEVTITYWEKWTGFEGEAMRATVERFNQRGVTDSAGRKIVCRYLSTTQVDRKSLLAIAGGNPPDLVGLWSTNTHVFAEMGALTPLDPFIAESGHDLSRYIPVFLSRCRYRSPANGVERTWCLPTTPASVALHWNKDLFRAAGLDPERPPQSIAEMEEYCEKLTRRDDSGRVVQMGFLPVEPGWWNWSWGYYFGGRLNDGPERITADDPKNIAAWEWVCGFAEKYGREQMLSFRQGFGTFDSPQNAFLSGKVAMVVQGVWMANFIRFHNSQLKYGCAAFPSAFDTGGQPVTVADMDVIAIPHGSRHPEQAWAVIAYINSQEGMEFLCGDRANNGGGQGKLTPFNETSPGWIEQHTHPYLQVFIDLAKSRNAVAIPQLLVWDEYQQELSTAFELAWLGKATPAEALKAVQARMQPKLDRALAIARARAQEKTK
ncbi:MAG: ABC transporter substrate-binding protein [Planctomycetes bacterium]|nr:ABC transporter substrate-binding protein [Planctomycetota bacterium]